MRSQLKRPQQGQRGRHSSLVWPTAAERLYNLGYEVGHPNKSAAAEYLSASAAKLQQGDLIQLSRKVETGEKRWHVPSTSLKFGSEACFPLFPRVCVQRALDVKEVARDRVQRNNVQLTLEAPFFSFSHQHRLPNEVPAMLQPLGGQLF